MTDKRWRCRVRCAIAVITIAGVGGCATARKEAWKNDYLSKKEFGELVLDIQTFREGGGKDLVLDRKLLEVGSKASVSRGQVTISHPGGSYQKGAVQAAAWLEGARKDAERNLGISVPTRLRLVIYPVDAEPRSLRARYEISAHEFFAPLVLSSKRRSAGDLLSGNFSSLVTIWHEIYEMLLITPWLKPTALPDADLSMGLRSKNYTRWFRDGFATYAAYVTLENLKRRSRGQWPQGQTFESLFYDRPLSSLSEVGGKLFRWNQFDSGRKNQAYYSASFGLFLLLEERFGKEGMKRLIDEVEKVEFPDGEGIIAAFDRALGVGLESYVNHYTFPQVAGALSEALAGSGGVFRNKVGNQVVDSVLEFELAVERARKTGSAVPVELGMGAETAVIQVPFD